MSRNQYHESTDSRLTGTGRRLGEVSLRGPGRWNSPAWLNGYADAGSPYADVEYRFGHGGELQMVGHVDVSGAASGDVAFVLDEDYWPSATITWLTDVLDGVSFSVARVTIDTSGNLRLYWPAN